MFTYNNILGTVILCVVFYVFYWVASRYSLEAAMMFLLIEIVAGEATYESFRK